MTEKIPGGIDAPHPIVAMCEHNGRVFLATQQRVYELVDGLWRPMIFVDAEQGIAVGQ